MRARVERFSRECESRCSRWKVHALSKHASTLTLPVLLLALARCEVAFPRQTQHTAVDGGGAGGTGTGGAPSGGTSGSGAADAGTVSGGSAGQENCLDGKDNDGNGFADCSDPACSSAGYSCQVSPPPGWQGYFRTAGDVYATTSPPPACPDGSQPVKYLSNPAPATCTPCSCGALSGGCDPARVDCAQNTNCAGATDWSSNFQICSQAGHPAALSCKLEAATPSAGTTCPASGGELAVKSTFERWLYACGGANQAGGGCVSGQSCAAPATTGPYSGTVCISKVGKQTCPAGWNTRLVGYASGTDTRGCSACTCSPSGVVCTGGAYTFYDHVNCSCSSYVNCQSNKVVDSTSCVDLSNLLDGSYTDAAGDWSGDYTQPTKLQSGSCTPSGGQPSGGIQTTGAVTFCCI